jgi:23S rRNA pseudouridine1911/1915/1917 synthase
LAALGHPILGDKLYGPEGVHTFLDYIETGMTDALLDRLGHERQALHAYELQFAHPSTGEPTILRAPLSDDLVALWGEPLSEETFDPVGAC